MPNKVPLGKVKVMSDPQIDEFTRVSTEDVELLRTAWRRYARKRYRDLIDALLDEDVLDINAAA